MKKLSVLFLLLAFAAPAHAGCYADYKAKRDGPLRLHYGVVALPDQSCTLPAATTYLETILAQANWQLLNVLGLFDESGLEERRDSAGRFYLRY